jgi:predicted transcriptional regulator
LEQALHAIRHPLRREMLRHLQRPLRPFELARACDRPHTTIAPHLQHLLRARCVEVVAEHARGKRVHRTYRGTVRVAIHTAPDELAISLVPIDERVWPG